MQSTLSQLQHQRDCDALSHNSEVEQLKGEIDALKRKNGELHHANLQVTNELSELRTRFFATSSELNDATNSLQELKSRTKSILDEQTRLQALYDRRGGVTRSKDDQIADLTHQCQSLQGVIAQMKEALERGTKEKAALAKQVQAATTRAENAEKRVVEAKSLRPSIKEETAKLQKSLKVAPSALEASLAKRGLGVVELYQRVVVLEEEVEKMKKAKEEAEMYLGHVLKEVEEKTPQLQQQQVEYQQMVNSQQRLNRMYTEISKYVNCGGVGGLTVV